MLSGELNLASVVLIPLKCFATARSPEELITCTVDPRYLRHDIHYILSVLPFEGEGGLL